MLLNSVKSFYFKSASKNKIILNKHLCVSCNLQAFAMKCPKCSHHNLTNVKLSHNYIQMIYAVIQGIKIDNRLDSNPLDQCINLFPKIDALVSFQHLFNSFFPYIAKILMPQTIPRERKEIHYGNFFGSIALYGSDAVLQFRRGKRNHSALIRQSIVSIEKRLYFKIAVF